MNIFSCRESTRLMSIAMERPLTFAEKFALSAHLITCSFCRRCRKEFAFLRSLLNRCADSSSFDSETAMPQDVKDRIRAKLN
ncbi:MAG: zf-HC2 domain-containing protein [Candidatus Hydrogenedentota bacterium]